ncbi:hypothetical protein BDV96DRAFT_574867 [Lophiotrema nucula]|uniref:FAD-binding domain-containing protein n=1 Tax=Lophiotrema nucula TaxID=690887 RepID=A0A6A5Z8V8_9PLEO|nr:hypothetical protein BDV96DRAFT_574867 [Lophiotrema nucula]
MRLRSLPVKAINICEQSSGRRIISIAPTMPLNVLVVGAGVCGPAFASLLQSSNPKHNITVIERSPSLRIAGQQIDLKAQGTPIVRSMGLLDEVWQHRVEETGMEIVDSNGNALARFGVNDSSKGERRNLTNEYEIMRGDLIKVFQEASLRRREQLKQQGETEGSMTYEFGKTITTLDQCDDAAEVTFSDGQKKTFDLVVAADGQASKTRRQVWGGEVSDASLHSLGAYAGFYSIPRGPADSAFAKIYNTTGKRYIMTRNGNRPKTQVYLWDLKHTEELRKLDKEPVEKRHRFWADNYKDAGWEAERFLEGLKTTDDWYSCEIAQVKLKELHKGRVVLLGDAGYGPSVFTGMGTTSSLFGAYVLAGELARNPNNIKGALNMYEEKLRPHIEEAQKVGGNFGLFPDSKLGIWLMRKALWIISSLKLDSLATSVMPEQKGEVEIPVYPELNLPVVS